MTNVAFSESKVVNTILTTEEIVFDPLKAKGYQQFQVLNLMLDTIVKKDSQFGLISGIAKSWKISKDQTEYTFIISDKAFFQDANPIRSNDIVFSLERILNDRTGSVITSYLKNVINSISAISEIEFKIKLKQPYAPFLELLTMPGYGILSSKSIENNFIGSGPFKFIEKKDDKWIFLRNSKYKFKMNNVEKYTFRIERDADKTISQLNSNEIQLAMGSPLEVAIDQTLDKDVVSSPTFSLVSTQIYLNLHNQFLKNKKYRIFLNNVINEIKHKKNIFTKFDLPLDTFFPKGIMPETYYNKSINEVDKKIIKLSKNIELRTIFPKGIFLEKSILEIVKIFSSYGVKLNYVVVKGKDLLDPILSGEFDMVFLPYQGVITDPDGYVDLLDSKSLLKQAAIPSEKILRELEKVRFIPNTKERLMSYEKLFKKFESEHYIIPFSQNSIPIVYSKSLKLPNLNFSFHLNLREINFDSK